MAPEISKQKPAARNSFDDELGDDFLSSWKPSKSLAALDFEDEEPVAKTCKSSFSLAKMDTSFDFDFDGGLNALSKFNVDMSDLDLPSSREKSHRVNNSSGEKQPRDDNKKSESKFAFEFKGFDELDLDDTLKTTREHEIPLQSKKGKRDFSPLSTTSKCRKKGILDSISDNASESTSVPTAGASMNKESHRTWNESTHDQGKHLEEFVFSDEENSARDTAHQFGRPFQGTEEQTSDVDTPQKGRDTDIKASDTFSAQVNNSGGYKSSTANYHCSKDSDEEVSTAISAEQKRALSTTPQLLQEPERNIEEERAAQSIEKPPNGMELDGSMAECEMQNLAVDKERIEERIDVHESIPPNENLMLGILEGSSEVETDEQQKSSTCSLKLRQGASHDGNFLLKEEKVSTNHVCEKRASTLHVDDGFVESVGLNAAKLKSQEPKVEGMDRSIAHEPHTLPTEVSPSGRQAKRKSREMMTSESSSSQQNSSKKLEVDDISKVAEVQEISDSATSQKKCKDSHSSLVEKHQDITPNPLPCRTSLKLVSDRSSMGAASFKKTTALPSLQSPRSLLGSPEYHSSHQRQFPLASGKSSSTHLRITVASQKKPTVLGHLQSLALPSVLQSNRSSLQHNSMKDASSRVLQVRSRPSTEKQLQGTTLRRTSGLAVLSKTRVMGALRESCEKTFKLDFGACKGIPGLPLTQSRKDLASSLKTVGDCDEKHVLENPDTEMLDMQSVEILEKSCLDKETEQTNATESLKADVQNEETLKEISNKEIVEATGDESHLAISAESHAAIIEKSEYYADCLDQLLKELKIKYEEAMDLRVRAMVVNNSLMMLNNPVDDEKIRKITHYVQEKLCLDVQGPAMTQAS